MVGAKNKNYMTTDKNMNYYLSCLKMERKLNTCTKISFKTK